MKQLSLEINNFSVGCFVDTTLLFKPTKNENLMSMIAILNICVQFTFKIKKASVTSFHKPIFKYAVYTCILNKS